MSAGLWRLGFEVTTEFQADQVEMTAALRAFTPRPPGVGASLVAYADHGVEVDSFNYLPPVDTQLQRDVDLRRPPGYHFLIVEPLLAPPLATRRLSIAGITELPAVPQSAAATRPAAAEAHIVVWHIADLHHEAKPGLAAGPLTVARAVRKRSPRGAGSTALPCPVSPSKLNNAIWPSNGLMVVPFGTTHD